MVFEPRAMLTAGITRETSPARRPVAWPAAGISVVIASVNERMSEAPKLKMDFVFIGDSPITEQSLSIVVTGAQTCCQLKTLKLLCSRYTWRGCRARVLNRLRGLPGRRSG